METLRKHYIDTAFSEAVLAICIHHKIPLCQASILASFKKDLVRLQVCRKDLPVKDLNTGEFYNTKMIALRLSKESVKKLLRVIHFAFIQEKEVATERISLLIYFSQLAGTVCIGILQDSKPVRTLKVSDLFDAMEIGNEQLN